MEQEKKKREAEHKEKYGQCLLYNVKECGPHKRRSSPVDGVFAAKDLTEDINPHFRTLKLQLDENWTEKTLVESRIGQSLQPEDVLCAYHRYNHGIWWKQPRSCAHPDSLKK